MFVARAEEDLAARVAAHESVWCGWQRWAGSAPGACAVRVSPFGATHVALAGPRGRAASPGAPSAWQPSFALISPAVCCYISPTKQQYHAISTHFSWQPCSSGSCDLLRPTVHATAGRGLPSAPAAQGHARPPRALHGQTCRRLCWVRPAQHPTLALCVLRAAGSGCSLEVREAASPALAAAAVAGAVLFLAAAPLSRSRAFRVGTGGLAFMLLSVLILAFAVSRCGSATRPHPEQTAVQHGCETRAVLEIKMHSSGVRSMLACCAACGAEHWYTIAWQGPGRAQGAGGMLDAAAIAAAPRRARLCSQPGGVGAQLHAQPALGRGVFRAARQQLCDHRAPGVRPLGPVLPPARLQQRARARAAAPRLPLRN